MAKRSIATILWFVAAWTFGSLLAGIFGFTTLVEPVLAVVVAALVWWDPSGRIWTRRPDNTIVRRRIADLARVSETRSPADVRLEADTARS
jgi:hypothetical protein